MTARTMETSVPKARAGGAPTWSRAWQNNAPGYLFLLPWFIGFFGLTIGPIISSLYLSFTDFDLLTSPDWIGFANYQRIFTADPKFAASMRVTLFFVLFSVPLKLASAPDSFPMGVRAPATMTEPGMWVSSPVRLWISIVWIPVVVGRKRRGGRARRRGGGVDPPQVGAVG